MSKPAKRFSDRVERWSAWIPGVRPYRDREQRRETDKKIRERLAGDLQEVRFSLNRTALALSSRGEMQILAGLDRLSSHLQQVADTIRYASYGYAGMFDLEKIREEELNRLYDFDLQLGDDLERVRKSAEEIGPAGSPEAQEKKIQEGEKILGSLENRFKERKEFMSLPAGGEK